MSGHSIDRAAIYVAFYEEGEYRFGTNAYSMSDLAPGATGETTPERPFEDVSVEEYQVFVASTRHDAWGAGNRTYAAVIDCQSGYRRTATSQEQSCGAIRSRS